jgi:hypothetical protein
LYEGITDGLGATYSVGRAFDEIEAFLREMLSELERCDSSIHGEWELDEPVASLPGKCSTCRAVLRLREVLEHTHNEGEDA